MKNATEIAERALVLIAISSAAYERPPISIRTWLEKSDLLDSLSGWERKFIAEDTSNNDEVALASWRIEACALLFWCLNRMDDLREPISQTSQAELGIDNELLIDPWAFIRTANLRCEADLQRMQVLIETQHWGVRSGPAGRAAFGGGDSNVELNPSIIYQRHYAINWVMGFEENWDEVMTDT